MPARTRSMRLARASSSAPRSSRSSLAQCWTAPRRRSSSRVSFWEWLGVLCRNCERYIFSSAVPEMLLFLLESWGETCCCFAPMLGMLWPPVLTHPHWAALHLVGARAARQGMHIGGGGHLLCVGGQLVTAVAAYSPSLFQASLWAASWHPGLHENSTLPALPPHPNSSTLRERPRSNPLAVSLPLQPSPPAMTRRLRMAWL